MFGLSAKPALDTLWLNPIHISHNPISSKITALCLFGDLVTWKRKSRSSSVAMEMDSVISSCYLMLCRLAWLFLHLLHFLLGSQLRGLMHHQCSFQFPKHSKMTWVITLLTLPCYQSLSKAFHCSAFTLCVKGLYWTRVRAEGLL